ncbi:MAG TPA: pyruvate dehydrogenase complex dihydrolipoamide acetyltransferase [Opitutaceae bacterium]|nr:pyruvate dehydrogenase complex dihydrolipoamide acetyltransferase [Opitutaceae bacterium]
MANIIDMPKLSDTMTVGTLVKWKKREGDAVNTGDILAEVETDKATMELESFFDGTLLKIFVPDGSQVSIGDALCAVGQPGETVAAPATKKVETGKLKAEPTASAASVPAAPVAASASKQSAPPPVAPPAPVAEVAASVSERMIVPGQRIRISPLARKLAAEKGIDYTGIAGSGPHGRIVRADIVAASKAGGKLETRNPKLETGGSAPLLSRGPIQEERTVAVSNMRGTIARRLLESKTQIPHFYVEVEIDAAPLLALRQQVNAALEKEGVKLSVNDFILKACAEALRRVPAVNASWENTQIRFFAAAHVAFAVAIDDGLITPVIRDAHLKTIFQIAAEAKQLAVLAKGKKLQPPQYTGGTFCVSNLGMMGVERFTAIINPPNSAILAVGAVVKKPVVKDDRVVVGQRMSLMLSCDHRVVDGALGATYLGALKQLLEAPSLLLI